MLNETQLKEKLQVMARDKFRLSEGDDLSELIPAMLGHIGSTDSFLRDDLIYSAFGTWIFRYNALDPEQLRYLLSEILGERHMLYKIGEQNTDSVFRRSFSVLLLPLLLVSHRSNPFLAASEIHQIKEKLLYYLGNERDRRGFVAEKGWAHSVAHAADALDDLAQCSELGRSDLAEILEAVRHVVCATDAGYVYLEEERIVTAVVAIIKRELLPDAEIARWIRGFADGALQIKSMPDGLVIRANVKNFLQSLHFRLQWEKIAGAMEEPISQTLKKINPFVKSEGD